jgi:two-component system OmpR family response regulator
MSQVLVIEDDDRIARFVTRALQSDGYTVERRPDGTSGLHEALASDYDLVILDLMLPDISGEQVLERLVDMRPEQRVLVLSAVPEIGSRVAVLEAGAADFLGKPFAIDELLARVRARLRAEAPGAAARWLHAGPISLDLRLHRASMDGRQVELSIREFLLLQHIIRRNGEPCTRAELLSDVWGITYGPGSNVVDVCVRRLRAKLDRPDRIETVRNVGYRIALH